MITRIVIEKKRPFARGHEFPVTGPYEKLVGAAYGELDPANPLNRPIVNLDRAPRNRRRRVEYRADIMILKPVDMRRGNGKILYEAPTPFRSRPSSDVTEQLTNPMAIGEILRALMVAMDLWADRGVPPPPSQIPRAANRTLVHPEKKSARFPAIPGGLRNRQLFLDYGPNLAHGKIEQHPPRQLKNGRYAILVPRVDADGNDIAGIRPTAIRVPLATYTGWNLQCAKLAQGELCQLLGSFIPFPGTREERARARDPLPSIEERYGDRDDYVRRVGVEVRSMVEERFLLTEDAERLIAESKDGAWTWTQVSLRSG